MKIRRYCIACRIPMIRCPSLLCPRCESLYPGAVSRAARAVEQDLASEERKLRMDYEATTRRTAFKSV